MKKIRTYLINLIQIQSEKNFEKLDEIVSKMQSGEISLGEALEAYKEGTLLVEDTAKRLDMIEKQITFINE